MKTTQGRALRFLLGVAVMVPLPIALMGCGNSASDTPPKNVGGLKTPSDILKESKAKESTSKP